MVLTDVCYLISESPVAHGVFAQKERTERKVFCSVQSVRQSEYYNAHNSGFQPERVLKLASEREYRDEMFLKFREKEYNVIRTYITPDGGIELTIQRSDNHV